MKTGSIAAAVLACAAGGVQGDVVTDWNNVWLDTIRATGGGPCPISRAGAMLHVAIFDAVNSIDPQYDAFERFVPVQEPADPTAAAAVAAHAVLVHLYPSREAIFGAALTASLSAVPDGEAEDNGVAVGLAAAGLCISNRLHDRSDDNTPYHFGNQPGDYVLTDNFVAPHGPNWYRCKTWVVNHAQQFRPDTPLGFPNVRQLLRSPGYAAQFDEVKRLGERNSAERTAEQTEIAWFWANDRDGTYKPPGHLNYATQVVSAQMGLGVSENARLFALLNLALADGVITTWWAKYHTAIDLWRPVTGIRQAHTDSNPLTTPDADWEPLLEFTPPFPAYTSGHSCMGGVWAAVMATYFGTDDVTFTIGTDEPIVQSVTRTFNRFSDAGIEDAISRVYLGVHWRMDCEQAYSSGFRIGEYVAENALLPLAAADYNRNGLVESRDLFEFTRDYVAGRLRADFDASGGVDQRDYDAFVRAYVGKK